MVDGDSSMMNSKKWALALLGAGALGATPVAEAEARTPRRSPLVQDTQAATLGTALISDDGATITAGIKVCSKQIEENSQVKFSFTTTYANDDAVLGDAEQFFEGPYTYELEREANNAINCREDENPDCQTLSEDALTIADGVAEVEVALRDLVGFSNAELCETEGTDMEHFVQLHILPNTTTVATEADYTEGRVIMDLIRPDAPIPDEGVSTASKMQLTVQVAEAEDVSGYFALISTERFEGGQLPSEMGREDELVPINLNATTGVGQFGVDLEEGTKVYVAVASRDEAKNYSVLSEPLEVDVVPTEDFWDYYVGAGGSETGGYGCTSTGGSSTSLWTLLVATMVLGVGRRRFTR
ncbi:hypothetical protein DV096_10620 [Bradymonadaceae bacterium TMQ3]|nr:hypothetical protein DV096_10620 [Bradymonadaceae bacterium TMQ3]TXC75927.1 hypothetical protein FRC91_10525 [Bradymonadales bacterium TMQ1]